MSADLTEDGVAHVHDVVDLLLQYLTMLRAAGPQRWLFDEMAAVAEMGFRFQEEMDPYSYVEVLAEDMRHYAPEHLLTGDALFFTYDAAGIAEILASMTSANMLISTISAAYADFCSETEEWFGTQYCRKPHPLEWVAIWAESDRICKTPSLHLPPPNDLIATDFALLKSKSASEPQASSELAVPRLLRSDAHGNLWFGLTDEGVGMGMRFCGSLICRHSLPGQDQDQQHLRHAKGRRLPADVHAGGLPVAPSRHAHRHVCAAARPQHERGCVCGQHRQSLLLCVCRKGLEEEGASVCQRNPPKLNFPNVQRANRRGSS